MRPELLKVFKPAFLGRVTIVPYLPLSDETFAKVVDLQLERVRARAEETYGVELLFSETLVNQIGQRARGTEIGARAVEQIIARELLPLLSRHFLERLGDKVRLSTLTVSLDDDGRLALGEGTRAAPDADIRPGQTSEAHVEPAEA